MVDKNKDYTTASILRVYEEPIYAAGVSLELPKRPVVDFRALHNQEQISFSTGVRSSLLLSSRGRDPGSIPGMGASDNYLWAVLSYKRFCSGVPLLCASVLLFCPRVYISLSCLCKV